ncbi:MAG: NAD(P)H-dependent oxidoreductase subunit E [Bacteroidales bacterium]|nr:NAD(P)H-dependent oxidoreductase subunit E [Bacteroidales bacterium]
MDNPLDRILKQYPNTRRDNLLPLLQDIHDSLGYLSEESIIKVSQHLSLPSSKVYGVATFFDQFHFEPQAHFVIRICSGTSCHLSGSAEIMDEFKKTLNIRPGQTTRDGVFRLEEVPCLGACGLSPIVEVNGESHTGFSVQQIADLVEACKENVA